MTRPVVGIGYVDGPRFVRALVAASDWVAANRDELNRINVFPVPDGDTGTNFSLTMRAVADAVVAGGHGSLSVTAAAASRAAVLGARGNSGMMLAHFLIGLSEGLAGLDRADQEQLATAVSNGATTLEEALDQPREGTIVTVVREAALSASATTDGAGDIVEFIRSLHREADRVLELTPELLPVLKQAGVVDAGGQGFVRMVEGIVRLIDGESAPAAVSSASDSTAPAALIDITAERDFQYCTEVLIRGESLPAANDVRAAMHDYGGSLVVAVAEDVLKIHVHTDTPDEVFSHAERWGQITSRKAEDMRAQHRQLQHISQKRIVVVVDSSNDLSDETLDRLGIIAVPHQVIFGNETFRDRVDLKPAEFYRKLKKSTDLPTTSQPAPAEFVKAFRAAREEAGEVIGILVSGALSGTLVSAQTAVQAAGINGVYLFDSKAASLGLGLLAIRAMELVEAGHGAAAIVKELGRVRSQSGGFVIVDQFENLLRSGRVSRGRAFLGNLLDIKPILELDQDGTIRPIERVRGQGQVIDRLLELVEERLTPRPSRLRFGIAHAEAEEKALVVAAELKRRFGVNDIVMGPATGVIGTHVGEGALAVFFQVEDGTPEVIVD